MVTVPVRVPGVEAQRAPGEREVGVGHSGAGGVEHELDDLRGTDVRAAVEVKAAVSAGTFSSAKSSVATSVTVTAVMLVRLIVRGGGEVGVAGVAGDKVVGADGEGVGEDGRRAGV